MRLFSFTEDKGAEDDDKEAALAAGGNADRRRDR